MSRELDEALGLPLVWYEILLYVNDAKNGVIPMAHLEDRITFSQSGLSQLLTRVENAGLIERRRDSSDGRRQKIAISEAGRDVLSAAARIHKKTIEDHFATLVDDREAVVIGRAFERILEAGRAKRESSRRRASASKNAKQFKEATPSPATIKRRRPA